MLRMNAVTNTMVNWVGGAVLNGIKCIRENSIAEVNIDVSISIPPRTSAPIKNPLNSVSSPIGANINAISEYIMRSLVKPGIGSINLPSPIRYPRYANTIEDDIDSINTCKIYLELGMDSLNPRTLISISKIYFANIHDTTK